MVMLRIQIYTLLGLGLPFSAASFWKLVVRGFSEVLADSVSAALMLSCFKRPIKEEDSSRNCS